MDGDVLHDQPVCIQILNVLVIMDGDVLHDQPVCIQILNMLVKTDGDVTRAEMSSAHVNDKIVSGRSFYPLFCFLLFLWTKLL